MTGVVARRCGYTRRMAAGPLLIAYDGSERSRCAIRRAGEIFHGREAIVLHVDEAIDPVLLSPIAVDIDVMLARRKMSVGELADRVGITPANLAVLKNGRAKAVRFATLAALCEALKCQPGDLLRWEADDAPSE